MAKKPTVAKPAAKTEPAQAPQAAQGTQKKINFVTLKHWATGTVNQTGQPILIIETTEDTNAGIRMTAQQAKEISTALGALVAKTPDKTN